MKKKLLFLFFFLTSFIIFSQSIEESIKLFESQTNASVTTNENSGEVEFIKFPRELPLIISGNNLIEKSFNFLKEYKSIYNLKSVENSFIYSKSMEDSFGLRTVIYKQVHEGIPVFDSQLKFHYNIDKDLVAVNGNFVPFIKISSRPSLSKTEASTIALQAIENQDLNPTGLKLNITKNNLIIFPKGLIYGNITSHHLVYEIEISNDLDTREVLYVDADSGDIVEQFTGMAHVINRVLYEGNISTTVWTEGDAFPGSLDQWQQNEIEAAGHMYNFFKNAFGYVSYDGNDAQMKTINNNPSINCPNANWNGTTANYCTGTASDDVVAHEWGHAYTEFTSKLIYAWQSGAINESYSDIWGETIDLLNNYEDDGEDLSLRTGCNSSQRWRIGEDASGFGGAIRDMWQPSCFNDPENVTDNIYWCSSGDNGGVHINSGIPNHAYALIVDGGTFNGQTISGIGFTKAAHIFWRAQNTYLTATSDFSALADALEAACSDLVGIDLEGLSTTDVPAGLSGEIITTFDCEQVAKAILAVELRINPDACNFETILDPIDPLCEASTSNYIFYEDWESGLGNWTVEQLPVNAATWEERDWVIEANLPKGRMGQGAFGIDPINGDCAADLQNGVIRLQSPLITIPDVSEGIYEMTFDHYVATENLWDGGNVQYRFDGSGTWNTIPATSFSQNPYNGVLETSAAGNDNPMEGQEAFTGTDEGSNSGSWGKSTIDLSSIGVTANSAIEFRWVLGTDGCNGRVGWYVDDIVIYNCSAALAVSKYDLLLQDISVYPNPANNIFTIRKLASLNLVKAEIFDINGRMIKEIDLSHMNFTKEIDIKELTTGIYFVAITSDDAKATVKLVKQ